MTRNTRTRILVSSLVLFNENGEPNTTTNEIADEVDISPGNLYYHFNKKSDLVDALLLEFQADARRVLHPPESQQASLDDFWLFLHVLLELTAGYRFLLRDMESLIAEYPKVGNALKHFARGVAASFELYLHGLAAGGQIKLDDRDMRVMSRNMAVIALFSEKFDALVDSPRTADDSAVHVAAAVLNMLKPFVAEDAAAHLAKLATYYES